MTSIYLILVAIFLFIIAINVNAELEKADFYKGMIFAISLLSFFASIIVHVVEKTI